MVDLLRVFRGVFSLFIFFVSANIYTECESIHSILLCMLLIRAMIFLGRDFVAIDVELGSRKSTIFTFFAYLILVERLKNSAIILTKCCLFFCCEAMRNTEVFIFCSIRSLLLVAFIFVWFYTSAKPGLTF